MVKIRLFRTGAVKRPTYRIVAMDERNRRQSRVLEQLGTYDPRSGAVIQVDEAAVQKWIGQGAQPSDTVRSLLKRRKKALAAAPASA